MRSWSGLAIFFPQLTSFHNLRTFSKKIELLLEYLKNKLVSHNYATRELNCIFPLCTLADMILFMKPLSFFQIF